MSIIMAEKKKMSPLERMMLLEIMDGRPGLSKPLCVLYNLPRGREALPWFIKNGHTGERFVKLLMDEFNGHMDLMVEYALK